MIPKGSNVYRKNASRQSDPEGVVCFVATPSYKHSNPSDSEKHLISFSINNESFGFIKK
ncbi:MAG: hypothetical protein ABI840_04935 [bacterium]